MFCRSIVVCSVAIILLSCGARFSASQEAVWGFEKHHAFIEQINKMRVVLNDEVTGGCMTYPQAVKEAAESEALRNGFDLSEDKGLSYIYINVLGFDLLDSICAVHVDVSLRGLILAKIPRDENNVALAVVPLLERGTLLTGPKSEMQSQLRSHVIEMVTSILLAVRKAAE